MDAKEEPVMFSCDVCGKGIANKCNLKRHKLMHSGYSESVRCEVCQKVLSSEGNLKRHMRMHMGIQDRQECNVCNKTFSNVGNLRRHMRTHQASSEQFECKICNKCFPYEDYLKKHIKTVHSADLKPEPESSGLPHIESFIKREDGMDEGSEMSQNRRSDSDVVCGNVTSPEEKKAPQDEEEEEEEESNDGSSSQHSNKEEEEEEEEEERLNGEPENVGPGSELREKLCPPEDCNICRLVLTDPAQVKLSVWRMHLDMRSLKKPGENVSFEFNCTVCGKFLSNKGNLKRHMMLLHKKDLIGGDVDVNVDQMRAQCEICGRIVANKGNLKRHMDKVHVIKRVGTEPSESGDNKDAADFLSNGSPAPKKRRGPKPVEPEGAAAAKTGLKIRLKNAAGPEEKGRTREESEPEAAKNGQRWRSRSFEEVYPQDAAGMEAQARELEAFSCPMCRRRFVCEENYRKHMKRHRSYKPQKPAEVTTPQDQPPMVEQQAVCTVCGIQMPFGAALQHHLTTVHRDVSDASAELTAPTACSSKLQNDFVNWSYPPILTRFLRRDHGAPDASLFPPGPRFEPPGPAVPPPASFCPPTAPLRKFVPGPHPHQAGCPPNPTEARDGPPVLVIMQPRCV